MASSGRYDRNPRAQVIPADDGLCVCTDDRATLIRGVPAAVINEALELVATSSIVELRAALGLRFGIDASELEDLERSLVASGLLRIAEPQQPVRQRSAVILGNGPLAEHVTRALEADERVSVRTAMLDSFDQQLATDVVICALEKVPQRVLWDIDAITREVGGTAIFVSSTADGAVVGPRVDAGVGPCIACRELATRFRRHPPQQALPILAMAETGAWCGGSATAAVVGALLLEELVGESRARSASIVVDKLGAWQRIELQPAAGCPICKSSSNVAAVEAYRAVAESISAAWLQSPPPQRAPVEDAITRVVVVGGGTAGYLAALALRRKLPHLSVTVLESSAIPVIGVGEASTPELVKFLHSPRFLGLDIGELFKRVRPTLKLGIQFLWGEPDKTFTFPFQRGRMLESQRYANHLDDQSLGAMLMRRDAGPGLRGPDGKITSLLHSVRSAYHLDNAPFVAYLRGQALDAGVEHLDVRILHAERDSRGDVSCLVTDDGQRLSYDFYVDCSGFRSVLLGNTLGVEFNDYNSSLVTDSALASEVPNHGHIRPYTIAETMDAGWCWTIPFGHEDHIGYVFSSAHSRQDEIESEMRARFPSMRQPRLVKFRSGRRRACWSHNVFALGNAYAFVEPLESTAIHMIVLTLDLLTQQFPRSRFDRAAQPLLNDRIGRLWDDLRWFLAVHYRFNRRRDTPFWQASRAHTDVSGVEQRLALWSERAPLSYASPLFYRQVPPSFFSDDHAFDTLLAGQGVPGGHAQPTIDRATWSRQVEMLRRVADLAMPHGEFVARAAEEPALVRDLLARADSWVHRWYTA